MPRNYHIAKDHILQAMPGTVAQLAKKSGYHRDTVERWLRVLRDGEPSKRGSHILDWLPPNGSGNFLPVHGAGPGKDVRCRLKAMTPSEKWQKRKPQFIVDGINVRARLERARYWTKRASYQADPLMAAMYPSAQGAQTQEGR